MNQTAAHRWKGLGVYLAIALTLLAAATSADAAPVSPPAAAPATPNWCQEASHTPLEPKSGQEVQISVPIAAGTTAVALQYQIVDPGAYIEKADPAYATKWLSVPMAAAGPPTGQWTVFTAKLAGTLQTNRRMVRYRISAKIADGTSQLSPSEEEGGNYGYFVYDGVPPWSGAIEPGSKDRKASARATFPAAVMQRVQVYELLGKKQSIENATWNEGAGGKDYKYTGTLVVDGVVYDHVRYRARGGVWRYALGKNQWKIDLPKSQRLPAKDDFGRPYADKWSKVNLRGVMQLGSFGQRGEQGLFETVGLRLFNMAGVAAPHTHWVELRIIDEAAETPADQYQGDFWGIYLAIENEDGRFLKGHDLPDGNLYKMSGGTGELGNHADGQPLDKSDLNQFQGAYNSKEQSEAWWRTNLDLPGYYSYRSILECIHHYDIADGKNYDYYRNPKTGKWQVIPWDLDLTWADNMYGNGDEPFNSRVLGKPVFHLEYQNRLREIRDLLYNPGQMDQLIDEAAGMVGALPGAPAAQSALTLAEADRRRWDFHPVMAKLGGEAGQGKFYEAAPSRDFAGMAARMKAYVVQRCKWVDETLLNDPKVPTTPAAAYAGAAGYPSAALRFKAAPYKGADAFAAMKWRLAEVTPKNARPTVPPTPGIYEIAAVWESDELAKFAPEITIPAGSTVPGHTYRVRVRMKDSAGRWSHWSAAVEFVAGG